ncbi:hypothetical protein NHX12_002842 [Muraenolepis orangiensis]|uniref:LysM and putative peptidoglycan-binding domain-containing protein 4 n=1 Tax=Muraenolepis orangiensis TaxID=630683 RepID=A0A9Q0E082_9TELE|nr:hypothetical protein NHX12_002842 [Muraenolepis orangiensis]
MRRLEPAPQAFQAPEEEGGEDFRVLELRPRFHPLQDQMEPDVQLLERELQEGDNLNRLALQYGCKVADIKRANNLFQEQDLFALKSIKIPLTKHSHLAEAHTGLTDPLKEIPTVSAAPTHHAGNDLAPPVLHEVSDFLKEVDHDIEKLIQSTKDRDDMFPDSDFSPRSGGRGRRLVIAGYGADWGIQWWNVVVAVLLIGVVLPIFYMVYFKTKASGEATVPVDGTSDASNSSADGTGAGLRGTGLPRSLENQG